MTSRRRRHVAGQVAIDWDGLGLSKSLRHQRALIRLAQSGDRAAMDRLCSDHDRYAAKLTHRWSHYARDWEDAMQCARIGIIEAIMSYDFSRPVKLLTVAHWKILGQLKGETRRRDRDAKISLHGLTGERQRYTDMYLD